MAVCTCYTLSLIFIFVLLLFLIPASFPFKGVFKGGGGFRGFKPPPPKFSDFFLKSEGKEIERKRKKWMLGGGGVTS